ncbi:MAG: zinc ABC transporter substrate-binding protein [Candidatus Omnitrophica bacterium]|nr:zinc ABC transporter substrate-binding protein [Candidatus Omnitrophota bacterium]
MRAVKVFVFALLTVLLSAPVVKAQPSLASEEKTIKVVASFYPMYIMALNVVKDVPGVTVSNLTPPMTGCLHDYTVTTDDMKKLVGANVFVANGAGMESFLDRIVSQYSQVKVVQLSEGIPLIKGEGEEGDNPHVWVSVSNAITEVKNLGVNMEKIDPAHAELYRMNTDEYVGKLETLRQKMQADLAQYKGKKIITFHEAFPYFAQEFGLEIAAVVEREPGSEPSAQDLADTVDIVKKAGIKALFSEPQYPALAAQTIAKETGATVYMLDPVVSGPDDPDAYLKIMEKNLEVLKDAFSK